MKKFLYWLFPKYFTIKKEVKGLDYTTAPKGVSIRLINEEGTNMAEVLGIANARLKELCGYMPSSFQPPKGENVMNYALVLLKNVSEECKHPNELAAMAVAVGMAIGERSGPVVLVAKKGKGGQNSLEMLDDDDDL